MPDDARVIRAASLVATPWPNGRGVTRDVVRHSTESGGIDWLLSIADLTEDAPFSHLPEIDRVFTLISGEPVELAIERDPPMLCRVLVPACFPGDRPTRCAMTGGPSRAFNLMFDRRTRRGRVGVLALAAGHSTWTGPATRALFCVSGPIRAGETRLETGDTLLPDAAIHVQAPETPALLLSVEIETLDRQR